MSSPVITSRLNLMIVGLALVVLSALVAGALGYRLGHGIAQSKGDAALADLRREHAAAVAVAAETARQRLLAEVDRNHRLAQQLATEKASHAQEKQTLLRRIANVTTVYVPAAGLAPRPLPRSVFTAGFVREYNTALGLPTADAGTAATGAGATTDAAYALDAGLRDSGLSQADILAHIADYGERCRNIESQLNRLLDRAEAE